MNDEPLDLPTGPMPPLPAPAGALEQVQHRARQRRLRRRALLSSSLAALLIAIAVPLSLRHGDGDAPQRVHTADGGSHAEPSSTSTTVVAGGPDGASTSSSTSTTIDPFLAEHQDALGSPDWLVGRAIDVDGNGVSGVFVYTGLNESGIPRPAATTDEHGYYEIACPTQPVVMTGAQINTWAGDHTPDQNWAPASVQRTDGAPLRNSCGSHEVLPTTVRYGGVIEGVVTGMNETSAGSLDVPTDMPWPGSNSQGFPTPYFFESFIWSDGTFRVIGLPPGDVVIYRATTNQGVEPIKWIKDTVHVESGKITKVTLQAPPPEYATTTAPTTTSSAP